MKTHYVLIDYENVHVQSLTLLKGEQFRVRVFLGKSNTKIHSELAIAMQKLGDRAEYVMLEASGSNALDFHIAYYLGVLASADPVGHFHIISKDKGFDPLIAHLNRRAMHAARVASIETMSCFEAEANVSVAQQSAITSMTKRKVGPAAKARAKSQATATTPALEAQIQAVIENLNHRKSARPAKMMTLLNTIHAKIGKQRPLAEAESVRDELVSRRHVVVNGMKLTYHLPAVG